MQQRSWILIGVITVLVAAFFILLGDSVSFRPRIELENSIALPKNEVFNGTYIRAANDVEINGVINGDAFIAGGNVTINGLIRGNTYLAASNVTINGTIGGGLHAVAQNVNVFGTVDQNVVAAGATVSVGSGTEETRVGSGIVAAGSTIKVNSTVQSDVYAAGNAVIINSEVKGNLFLAGPDLSLGSEARVSGKVQYASDNDIEQEDGSQVVGEVNKTDVKLQQNRGDQIKNGIVWNLFGILSTLVLGAVLIWFVPKSTEEISTDIQKNFLKTLGVGWIFVLGAPIGLIIFFASVVGIKLGLIALMTYVAMFVAGGVFVALMIGRLVLPRRSGNFILDSFSALLLGLVVLALINVLPALNMLFAIFVSPAGIGAAVRKIWRAAGELRTKQRKELKI